jgi:hypothetical protein
VVRRATRMKMWKGSLVEGAAGFGTGAREEA